MGKHHDKVLKGLEKRREAGYLPANDAINAKAFIDKVAEYHENKKSGKPTYVGWGKIGRAHV